MIHREMIDTLVEIDIEDRREVAMKDQDIVIMSHHLLKDIIVSLEAIVIIIIIMTTSKRIGKEKM
jgi:hypothetical protein